MSSAASATARSSAGNAASSGANCCANCSRRYWRTWSYPWATARFRHPTVHGAAGQRRELAIGREADGDQAVDTLVERAVTQILDVEDRPQLTHDASDRGQHQVGAIVEVAVDRAVRHTGARGDVLDRWFVDALVGQCDECVEDGVLVALPASGSPVHDQVGTGSHVVVLDVDGVHGVLRGSGRWVRGASPGARTLNQWIKSPLLYH